MTVHGHETFTMVATGDVIQTRPILPYEGTAPEFDDLLDTLRAADATVGNLEVLVHDYEGYPAATSGGTYMRAPPTVLDDLSEVGFDLFSAATNHTFDYSHGGIEATLDNLERRDLPAAGLGRTLFEARKPAYLETPAGRVGLVSACTSFPPGSEAGEQSRALPGRPGLNPIHVSKVHRLPPDDLEALERISEVAGIEDVKEGWFERGLLYGHDWAQEEYFHFGDMKFRADDDGDVGIEHEADEEDAEAFTSWIADANRNANWVVASVHTHQGRRGLDKTAETPSFLVDLAHEAVDAGADAVICHGPHVLRGIELYREAPICYSLGNFVVQNETVSRLPPESFRRYDLTEYTRVSDVFERRLYDDGNPKGDLADDRFWRTIVPRCRFDTAGDLEVELLPCTLQQSADRPQRGTPVLATGEEATDVLSTVADLSEGFDTEVAVEDGVGVLSA